MEAATLASVLSEHLGRHVRVRTDPAPISGGFWAAIYRFELVADIESPAPWRAPLILRVMPSRTRAIHETAFQRAVADSGFPTPAVLLSGDAPSIGGAFMVMPFIDGRSPMSGLGVRAIPQVPKLLRNLPLQIADVALQLHALDPAPVREAIAASGVPAAADGEHSRLDAITVAASTASGGFDRLLDWFETRRPRDVERVVSHGDLHPFNLLVDGEGRTFVVDWTNGDFMPREFEVGFTAGFLRCPPVAVPRAVRPAARRMTNWLAERFIDHYAQRAPLDRDRLRWFEALQHARCMAEVATARAGLTTIVDERHPFEVSADEMLRRLAELTGITVTLPPARGSERRTG